MTPHSRFGASALPYLLVAPQLAITAIFFLWPAGVALWQSTQMQDAFGTSSEFVGFANFAQLFGDPLYVDSFKTTLVFSASVTVCGLVASLLLAACADRVIRGARAYRTLLIWPYAVAPTIAAVLWAFLFNPSIGVITYALARFGIVWNHALNGGQAMLLVVIASCGSRSATLPWSLCRAAGDSALADRSGRDRRRGPRAGASFTSRCRCCRRRAFSCSSSISSTRSSTRSR